jgi:hypothetical protein
MQRQGPQSLGLEKKVANYHWIKGTLTDLHTDFLTLIHIFDVTIKKFNY